MTELGWQWDGPRKPMAAKVEYGLQDLIDCIEHDPEIPGSIDQKHT